MLSLKLAYKRVPDVKVLLLREMHRSYYDALGLTPKASNADIKQAYYKMSMLYHPDKEEGNPDRFREITTAYEVLSNLKLRKLYDQGLLPADSISSAAAEEATIKRGDERRVAAEKSRQNFYANAGATNFERAEGKPFTGKTEQFNYDAWTQAHYAETLTRETERKARADVVKKKKKRLRDMDDDEMRRQDQLIAAVLFTVAIVLCVYVNNLHVKSDVPVFQAKRSE